MSLLACMITHSLFIRNILYTAIITNCTLQESRCLSAFLFIYILSRTIELSFEHLENLYVLCVIVKNCLVTMQTVFSYMMKFVGIIILMQRISGQSLVIKSLTR